MTDKGKSTDPSHCPIKLSWVYQRAPLLSMSLPCCRVIHQWSGVQFHI